MQEAGLTCFPNKVGDGTRSPIYNFGGHQWYIIIYPGGDEDEGKGHLSCFLHCTSDEPIVRASYSISILDHSGQQQEECISDLHEFQNDGHGWSTFVSQQDLKSPTKGYCINDTLTILAEITVWGVVKKYKKTETAIPCNQTIVSSLSNLLSDNSTSDVTVIVKSSSNLGSVEKNITSTSDTSCQSAVTKSNKRKHDDMESEGEDKQSAVRIPAHRLILYMRSPVFRTMFASGMAEALTNEVRIQDFDAAVVKEFLRFLYTDQCEVDKHAEQLLAMACKYQVPGLKYFCENHLCAMIDSTSVLSLLSFAHLYDAAYLKTGVLRYITRHAKEVVVVEGFMENISPDLMKEVVFALAGLPKDG